MMPAGPSPENKADNAARGDRPAGPTISDTSMSASVSTKSAALSRQTSGEEVSHSERY